VARLAYLHMPSRKHRRGVLTLKPTWMRQSSSPARLGSLLAALTLILAATLSGHGSSDGHAAKRWCLNCSPVSATDLVANALLFVPLGIALLFMLTSERWKIARVILLAVLLSFAIETLQFTGAVSGRIASVLDILCNGAGAAAGALFALLLRGALQAAPKAALMMLATWCVFVHVVLFVSGAGLQRSDEWQALDSPTRRMAAQAAQDFPHRSTLPFTTGFGWFEQPVPWATVDGVPFENRNGSGPIIVTSPARRSHTLAVRVSGRDRRLTFVPVLFVHSPEDLHPHVTVGQRGAEFGLVVKVKASRSGMQMPPVRVGFPAITDSVVVRAAITEHTWTLELWHDGSAFAIDRSSVQVRPVLGLLLLLPVRSVNGVVGVLLTCAAVLLMALPLFYLAAKNTALATLTAFLSALSALVVPAAVTGLAMPTMGDWIALFLAMVIPWIAARCQPKPMRT
jgi:hypothetical protein